ncbi:MAG: hypothetical protein KAH32_04345, partial [Chlamydiia bacterium]|nr:hypothetical protein [Chlamydiia bacterium]
ISKTGFTAPPGSPFVGIKITGYKTADQIKMNGITADMVRTEIIKEVGVGTGQATPSMPNAWSTTLNHLDGVSIALSS